mgnify:CR=1 FL=1
MASQTIKQTIRTWIEQFPWGDYPDLFFSEVNAIIHQGKVVGVDITIKDRGRFSTGPPQDSATTTSEPNRD